MLALLFPGQGSQEVGMGRDVCEASPAARAVFERADAALGLPLSKLCFEGPEQELRRTEIQQPALLTTSIALLAALEEQLPLAPAFLLGHSLGEYSALVAARALGFEDAVTLVHARGRFMQEAVPPGRGAMAAILGIGVEAVAEACREAARRDRRRGVACEPERARADRDRGRSARGGAGRGAREGRGREAHRARSPSPLPSTAR